jgi:hypothetical protein
MSLNSFHFNGIFLACKFLGNFLIFFMGIFRGFFLGFFSIFFGVYWSTNWMILQLLVALNQVPIYSDKGQDSDDFWELVGHQGRLQSGSSVIWWVRTKNSWKFQHRLQSERDLVSQTFWNFSWVKKLFLSLPQLHPASSRISRMDSSSPFI